MPTATAKEDIIELKAVLVELKRRQAKLFAEVDRYESEIKIQRDAAFKRAKADPENAREIIEKARALLAEMEANARNKKKELQKINAEIDTL